MKHDTYLTGAPAGAAGAGGAAATGAGGATGAGATGAAATGAGAAAAGAAAAGAAPASRCLRYSSKEGAAPIDLRGSSWIIASGSRVSNIPPDPLILKENDDCSANC